MTPLSIATEGWLDLPLGAATSGYIILDIPDSIDTESILKLATEAELQQTIFFIEDEVLKVKFITEELQTLEVEEGLLNKTVEFFSTKLNLEVESYSEQKIKFTMNETITLSTEKGLVDPLEVQDTTGEVCGVGI